VFSLYIGFGPRAPDLQRSAAVVARSVYLIAIDGPSGRRPLGTAFAVSADGLLATNAHVADALRQVTSRESRARGVALRSDTESVRVITGIDMHPSWRAGSIADDVALLGLDGDDRLEPLRLADEATVAQLPRGLALACFGFPGAGLDLTHPRGRLTMGVLGDMRDRRYLAIGLEIAPGTSGSPIFRSDGLVVGLVAGGDFVSGASGALESSGSGVNWGISVAALHDLLVKH
jgi:S1-C subfamily serine protease